MCWGKNGSIILSVPRNNRVRYFLRNEKKKKKHLHTSHNAFQLGAPSHHLHNVIGNGTDSMVLDIDTQSRCFMEYVQLVILFIYFFSQFAL